jgi:hypothetical protein
MLVAFTACIYPLLKPRMLEKFGPAYQCMFLPLIFPLGTSAARRLWVCDVLQETPLTRVENMELNIDAFVNGP